MIDEPVEERLWGTFLVVSPASRNALQWMEKDGNSRAPYAALGSQLIVHGTSRSQRRKTADYVATSTGMRILKLYGHTVADSCASTKLVRVYIPPNSYAHTSTNLSVHRTQYDYTVLHHDDDMMTPNMNG